MKLLPVLTKVLAEGTLKVLPLFKAVIGNTLKLAAKLLTVELLKVLVLPVKFVVPVETVIPIVAGFKPALVVIAQALPSSKPLRPKIRVIHS